MTDRAPLHYMEVDVEKLVCSIAFLIAESEREAFVPTQYDIVKSLFLAERSHINEWGRPITYDKYVAMYHGPVPSLGYDLLKVNEHAMRKHGISDLPWRRSPAGGGKFQYRPTTEELDFDEVLSPSDIEALKAGLVAVRKLGFSQIRNLTHEDAAYVEAWNAREGSQASDMSLGLLFEDPDHERAEDLSEYSPYVQPR